MPIDHHRRNFLIAIPAVLVLSACIRPSKVLEGSWGQFASYNGRVVDHGAWDAFLARYLRPGDDGINRVAYAEAAQSDPQMLRAYLASLETIDPATLLARPFEMMERDAFKVALAEIGAMEGAA